ncbi:MAG: beta-L-arabinofuranosidase domain-containing protein [Planctomycetota bacterium]
MSSRRAPQWGRTSTSRPKGFGDTRCVLGGRRIIDEAELWIEAASASQRQDGYFGPVANLTNIHTEHDHKPGLWPNMIMLMALQSYHERSGDKRVLDLVTRYFRWEAGTPEEDFLLPFRQQQRAADNLAGVYWLYNRTGKEWLLDLATTIQSLGRTKQVCWCGRESRPC